MSPTPGRSTLITSAPNHANNCVQVGPDCTWVKSRIRTPSSALPMALSLVHGLVLGTRRVLARVHPDIDDCRLAQPRHRLTRTTQRGSDLRWIPHLLAIAAQHLGKL